MSDKPRTFEEWWEPDGAFVMTIRAAEFRSCWQAAIASLAIPDGVVLPDCMMPDGADPCQGYQSLSARIAELEVELARLKAHADAIAAAPTLDDRARAVHAYRFAYPKEGS